MNRHPPFSNPPAQGHAPLTLVQTGIALALGEHCFLLDDGRVARQAPSCLIAPAPGDRVLAGVGDDDCYVLHLLQRAAPALAELSVPGASELRIEQARLSLHGRDEVALHSLHKVDIEAAGGLLSLHAADIHSCASDTLVQSMRHYAGSAEQYLLDVSELLRIHGRHAILDAEQDVRLDGERISLG